MAENGVTLTPLKKTKLYEEISAQLVSHIHSGHFKPGDKLPPERTLAEQLGVSRTAIREALRSLESMGYIESKVGGGTYVRAISLESIISPVSAMLNKDEKLIAELLSVRLLLETEIASLAAQNITLEKAAKLKTSLQVMEEEIARGEIGLTGDNMFHSCLAEISENGAMSLISDMCAELLSKTRLATLEIPGQPQDTVRDHYEIYDAVIAGNAALAAKKMTMHLNKAHENLARRTALEKEEEK